jgi:hypothetical protein
MVNQTGRSSDKFMLRLPDGLRDRIKKKADDNSRSMNGEIIQLLEREYPEPKDIMYVHVDNIRKALELYEKETDPRARMRLQNLVQDMTTVGHNLEIDWEEAW